MTVYLDPDLEVLLKLEAMRRKQPMAELFREALRSYFADVPRKIPPGAGEFDSGHTDTAERAEEILRTGFGQRKTTLSLKELQGSIKVGPGDPVEDVRKARQLIGTKGR